MTKQELITELESIAEKWNDDNPEKGHPEADKALLKYINDDEVTEAFNKVERWYA